MYLLRVSHGRSGTTASVERNCELKQQTKFVAAILGALLISGCAALAGASPVAVPQDLAPADPALAAHAKAAIERLIASSGAAHEGNTFGRILLVDPQWEPQRNQYGVLVGRGRKMDALSKSSSAGCGLWHFLVVEDGGVYKAYPIERAVGDAVRNRHPVACSDL